MNLEAYEAICLFLYTFDWQDINYIPTIRKKVAAGGTAIKCRACCIFPPKTLIYHFHLEG